MKKLLTAALAALFITVTVGESAEAYEDTGGFAVEAERALPAKTPYDKSYVEILWNTSEAETAGAPIADGEFVLLPVRNTVRKLNRKDGSIAAAAELDELISEDHSGAVAGDVLVQPTETSIYAVDLNGMEVICSRQFGDIATDVAIIDKLVYFGVKSENAYKFVCADIGKGLETVWEYVSDSPITSPALFGEYVVFGAGEALAVCRFDSGRCVENPVGAEITNVFAGQYAVFMTCADGSLRKLRLEDSGQTEEDTLTILDIGGVLTAPAEFNNRVYVGSTEGFYVLDGLNMEILKAYPEMKNASAPIVCYGNGQRAYTVAPHLDSGRDIWYLYGILDTEAGQTASEIAKIIDYTNGRLAVSDSGVMYFRDADGQLWALAVKETNYFVVVIKIILTLAIVVMVVVTISALAKKRNSNKPPRY